MVVLEVCLLLLLLAFLLYRSSRKPASMPPGTFGLPVFGNLPPLNAPLVQYFLKLKRKYGNIFTTKWGSRPIVCLTDPGLVKRVLSNPDVQDRPYLYSFEANFSKGNHGVINSNGKVWKNNRRFLLHNLRDLGMGKTHIEDSINNEVQMLVSHFEQHYLNKPKEIELHVNVAVVNVIWAMLADLRYSTDDPEIIEYNKMVSQNVDVLQGSVMIIDFMPWILNVVPGFLVRKITGVNKIINNRETFYKLCLKIIKDHKNKLDPDNPVDIIDHYLLEIEANKDNPDTSFKSDYRDLLVVMNDLFAAGSETTSTTIRWTIFYLASNPEIQAKVHKLLDEVVPKDRLPSMQDRENLAYLDAVLLDVQRLASLVPLSVPHSTARDVQIDGYVIPKDTIILPCLELCHRDPAYWEKPDQLHPEHFLDSNGKLDSKKEAFMPFSVGRRQCLGEGLARMEVYLFTSAILHKFVITPPPGETLVPRTDPNKILLNMPVPFKVVMKKRI